jgi:hypothetical protein
VTENGLNLGQILDCNCPAHLTLKQRLAEVGPSRSFEAISRLLATLNWQEAVGISIDQFRKSPLGVTFVDQRGRSLPSRY